MIKRLLLLAPLLLFAPLSAAEEAAVALRDSNLQAKPHSDAAVSGKVKKKAPLQVLQRQGGWYQVRNQQGQSGWLRMSRIRLGDGSSKDDQGSGLAQTLNFLSTGRSGASGVTVATGIRGLDAADVSKAKPDHAAVKQLDRYKVSDTNANNFASQGQLHSVKLRYFKEPE